MFKYFVQIFAACVLASGCAGTAPVTPFNSIPDPATAQSWGDPIRVVFVAEFSGAADLGVGTGFWSKLSQAIVGKRQDSLVRPMAVAADSERRVIYVADPGARCIHRFNLETRRYRCLTVSRHEMLASPVGLALGPHGRLYATDSLLATVYTAGPDDNMLQPLELDTPLLRPTGVSYHIQSGRLAVADTLAQSVLFFDDEGKLQTEVAGRGSSPGLLNFPTYLWADEDGEIVLTDSLNFRVQRFDSRGSFVHAFGEVGDAAGTFARPKGVATDTEGHVYVVDALFHAVQVFDKDGSLLLAIGQQGSGPGQFWLPNGIFITDDQLIFIADSYNRRIQVFRYLSVES